MGALETAIAIAAKAHQGQTDKAGHPYILHPLRVMLSVESEEQRIAAVLHDLLERATVTVDQMIAAKLPTASVAAVLALTRQEGEAYETFIERVGRNTIARAVKLSAIRDNLLSERAASCPAELREGYMRAMAVLMRG